jgi:hypothetical protein
MGSRLPGAAACVAACVLIVAACQSATVPDVQPEAPSGIYGSGIAMDAKDNYQLSGRRLAHRFRAGTTSELLSVRVQQRGGEVYSAGDGGIVRISIQADDGSRAHLPSGEVLAEVEVEPGNPEGDWTTYEAWDFPEPATLTAGELYHVVFENRAPDPAEDYISINEIFMFQPTEPRQPALLDEYAVLYDRGDGWELELTATADMDLSYADGTHDGVAYIQNMCDRYGVIAGPDALVRERFTVTGGDRFVGTVAVRLKRTSGDDPLVISVQADDGTVLAESTVAAASVPQAEPGCSEETATWIEVSLEPPVLLEEGATYDLRLATGRASQYTAEPIREGTDEVMLSYRFIDGGAERSTDGGSAWAPLYPHSPVDLQFHLQPAA